MSLLLPPLISLNVHLWRFIRLINNFGSKNNIKVKEEIKRELKQIVNVQLCKRISHSLL